MGTESVFFFLTHFWHPLCARVTWSKSTADRLFWTGTGHACIRQDNKTQLLNRYRVSLSINIFCREEFRQNKNCEKAGESEEWTLRLWRKKKRKSIQSRNWR